LVGDTVPIVVVLIQLGFSALISLIFVTVKFQYLDVSRNTIIGCLLGILHPGLSGSIGIIALSHVDVSIFSTIWALEAVITLLLASVLLAERVSVMQIVLSVVSLVGVLLASTNFQQPAMTFEQFYWMAILLAAVLSCGLYATISGAIVLENRDDALVLAAGQQVTGLLWIGMMMFLARSGQIQDVANLSHMAWLLCISTGVLKYFFATGLFLVSLRYLSVSLASSFLVLTPVFGITAAVSFLGERLSNGQWLGVLTALLSVLAMQFADRYQDE
jgi:drug/metabolite transporter (DMT)-like permease